MMHHDDSNLGQWLADGPDQGSTIGLDAALARARHTGQRPAWVVGLAGGTIAERPGASVVRAAVFAMAAVALIVLLAGALVAGGIIHLPPIPSIITTESTPAPSGAPSIGLVAYTATQCEPRSSSQPGPYLHDCPSTGWLAANDGSGARELPGTPLGWSADGSALLVRGTAALVLTDAHGSQLGTFPITCSDKEASCAAASNVLCKFPCTMADSFALSPDGTRVAFVRGYANGDNATVITILDLASGQTTELTGTRTTNPPTQERCYAVATCQGDDDTPRWSPDGSRLVFARQVMSPDSAATAWTSAALFVVDADGENLRRVTPTGLYAFDPGWSPGGGTLVFTNNAFTVNADRTSVLSMATDVYTIGLDGTNLTRLTNDGISARPSWTLRGQLVFARAVGQAGAGGDSAGHEQWGMDGNGASQHRTGESLAELTAAGCVTCFYEVDPGSGLQPAYWQPTSGGG